MALCQLLSAGAVPLLCSTQAENDAFVCVKTSLPHFQLLPVISMWVTWLIARGEERQKGECRNCPSYTCLPTLVWRWMSNTRAPWSQGARICTVLGDNVESSLWIFSSVLLLASLFALSKGSSGMEGVYRQGRGCCFPAAREGASGDKLPRLHVSHSVQPPSSRGPKTPGGCGGMGGRSFCEIGPEMGHELKHIQASGTRFALSTQRNSTAARLG